MVRDSIVIASLKGLGYIRPLFEGFVHFATCLKKIEFVSLHWGHRITIIVQNGGDGINMIGKRCREDPSLGVDREAEPPGFWTGRIQSLH